MGRHGGLKEGLLGYNYMNSAALYRPIVGDYDFAHWVDCNYNDGCFICGFLTIIRANSLCVWKYLRAWLMIKYPHSDPGRLSTKGQNFWWGGHSGYDCSRPVLYNSAEKKALFYKILMTADEWDMTTMQPIRGIFCLESPSFFPKD